MNKLKEIKVLENASLKDLNTYKIPSKAKYLITIENEDDLIEVLKDLQSKNISYYILGAGSNVILDDYFDGAIIKIDIKKIEINNLKVTASAGVMMGKLATSTVNNNLTGLEWAINIPGTVGGSIVNNAGAYNSEIFDNLISIKVLNKDLEIIEIKKEALKYSYRSTNIKSLDLIVLEAEFLLQKGDKETSLELIKNRCERRKATQPLDMPSAGSVFRNPEGNFAGKLIEDAGLKGKQIGGAKVSTKHANFIVNVGNATSNDIKSLIELIKKEVKVKFGIDLITEQEKLEWKRINGDNGKGKD